MGVAGIVVAGITEYWISTGAGFGRRSRWRWPPRIPRGRSTTHDPRTARRYRAPGTCGPSARSAARGWAPSAPAGRRRLPSARLRWQRPRSSRPSKPLLDWVKSSGADIRIGNDPEQAVKSADCVVTDTWVSMGDRSGARRHNLLKPYQVNAALMAKAKPDALFMHCLPAHRGEEVTDEVMDGPQSVVFDEAENRLHAQKGILAWCLDADQR